MDVRNLRRVCPTGWLWVHVVSSAVQSGSGCVTRPFIMLTSVIPENSSVMTMSRLAAHAHIGPKLVEADHAPEEVFCGQHRSAKMRYFSYPSFLCRHSEHLGAFGDPRNVRHRRILAGLLRAMMCRADAAEPVVGLWAIRVVNPPRNISPGVSQVCPTLH